MPRRFGAARTSQIPSGLLRLAPSPTSITLPKSSGQLLSSSSPFPFHLITRRRPQVEPQRSVGRGRHCSPASLRPIIPCYTSQHGNVNYKYSVLLTVAAEEGCRRCVLPCDGRSESRLEVLLGEGAAGMRFEVVLEGRGFVPGSKGNGGLDLPGAELGRVGRLTTVVSLRTRLQVGGHSHIMSVRLRGWRRCAVTIFARRHGRQAKNGGGGIRTQNIHCHNRYTIATILLQIVAQSRWNAVLTNRTKHLSHSLTALRNTN